jgi:hypothetical protein
MNSITAISSDPVYPLPAPQHIPRASLDKGTQLISRHRRKRPAHAPPPQRINTLKTIITRPAIKHVNNPRNTAQAVSSTPTPQILNRHVNHIPLAHLAALRLATGDRDNCGPPSRVSDKINALTAAHKIPAKTTVNYILARPAINHISRRTTDKYIITLTTVKRNRASASNQSVSKTTAIQHLNITMNIIALSRRTVIASIIKTHRDRHSR